MHCLICRLLGTKHKLTDHDDVSLCGDPSEGSSKIGVMDYAKYGNLYSKGLKYLIT